MILLPLQASPAPFPGAGELFAFASALVWGVATVLFTVAFKKGNARDAVLLKNMGGAVLLGLIAWMVGPNLGGGAAGDGNLRWLLASGFIGLGIGDWLYFVALMHIGVGRTLILTQALPVTTAIAAWFTHGEKLSSGQWFGALLIVGGGLLAESRREIRGRADSIGVFAALGAVLAMTISNVTLREGVTDTNIITGAAWRLTGGAIGIMLVSYFHRDLGRSIRSSFSAKTWRLFLLPSAIGTWLGMSLLSGGFKWAKQGVASALASSVPIISIPLAVVLLHEKPGWKGWCGALLVVAGAATLGLAA